MHMDLTTPTVTIGLVSFPHQGDKVKIQIVETSTPSPPLKIEKQDRKEMLARYAQLKKELEEKGLITEEDMKQ